MKKYRTAIVGLGATGTVLAAALLRKDPKSMLVGRSKDMGETLVKDGIRVSGAISYFVPVENYCVSIQDLGKYSPNLIFISTKTCDLTRVLDAQSSSASIPARSGGTHRRI